MNDRALILDVAYALSAGLATFIAQLEGEDGKDEQDDCQHPFDMREANPVSGHPHDFLCRQCLQVVRPKEQEVAHAGIE